MITCQEMIEAEERFFSDGGKAEPLMDLAGMRCAEAICSFFPTPGSATLYCGKGNNGGDALVAGRWLRKRGWRVKVDLSHPREAMTDLAQKKLAELEQTDSCSLSAASGWQPSSPCILIDGLLGIGAKGALRGALRDGAGRLQREREEEKGYCFAIDIPSGVDGDSGEPYDAAVAADFTLSICQPKSGILADSAINHVGRIVEIPLEELPVSLPRMSPPRATAIFPSQLRNRIPRRKFDTHKGQAGRVCLVAGSSGLTGAAVLNALGASRGGAGLVSLLVPEKVYEIVAAAAPPEVMVSPLLDALEEIRADVFAIGSGMGNEIPESLFEFLLRDSRPIILDADILRGVAQRSLQKQLSQAGPRLLTPHPGELRDLCENHDLFEKDRVALARQLAENWQLTLLYKGTRSVIASPGSATEINTTGHPGMASGGMGDALTGLATALVANGLSLHDAACTGSWLLGRAAEHCVYRQGMAGNSISATHVAEALPWALAELC